MCVRVAMLLNVDTVKFSQDSHTWQFLDRLCDSYLGDLFSQRRHYSLWIGQFLKVADKAAVLFDFEVATLAVYLSEFN
jgi:hypothetical protein